MRNTKGFTIKLTEQMIILKLNPSDHFSRLHLFLRNLIKNNISQSPNVPGIKIINHDEAFSLRFEV